MMQRSLIPLLAAFLTLVGCTVHQYPADGGPEDSAVVDLTLNLRFEKQLPKYQQLDFVSKAATSVRYVVCLYKYQGGTFEEVPSVTMIQLEESMADRSYTLQVPPAHYRIQAWVDYANTDGTSLYYDAEDFSAVSLMYGASYPGNEPLRDAFYGLEDIDLSFLRENHTDFSQTIGLKRPNARIEFVATDKDQFLKTNSTNADMSNCTVKISYPLFLPTNFNVSLERPTDSRAGVEFTTRMEPREDGTIGLGFDWIFASYVADELQTVVVNLSFFDPTGASLGSVNNIEVPIFPGKSTLVKGNLLTNGVSNGISINPDFDGEFVINI